MTDIKWGFSGEEAKVKTVQYDAQIQAAKDSRGPDNKLVIAAKGEARIRLLYTESGTYFHKSRLFCFL